MLATNFVAAAAGSGPPTVTIIRCVFMPQQTGIEDDRGSGGGSGGISRGRAGAPPSTIGHIAGAGTRAGDGKHELGLSRNGKTLLVAAYLASHNSRDTGGFLSFWGGGRGEGG